MTTREQNANHLGNRTTFEMAQYAEQLQNILRGVKQEEQQEILKREADNAVEALCKGIVQQQNQYRQQNQQNPRA